jgi:FKBP-type peptidyl-prolyl cis-trans isomerase SlpA
VRLHLAIHLEDGTEVLSSFGDEPLEFRVGDGTLVPGLESMLMGLQAGADEQMLADGAAVYGEPDPALVHCLERADLPPDFEFAPGRVMLFEAPGGQQTAGTLLSETETGVEVDFNHPLSHRGLRIRVRVLEVG